MRRSLCSCVLVLSLAAGTARAENPYLDRARAQKAQLQYATARASLRRALESGTNDADQLAAIYRMIGEIEAGLGHPAAAIAAFEKLLALHPGASFPSGTSPKLAGPFGKAMQFFSDHQPLSVHVEVIDGRSVTPPAVDITVESDPLHMVTGARVQYVAAGGAPVTLRAHGTTHLHFALPRRRLRLMVTVVDRHGNALVTDGTRMAPIEVGAQPATASSRPAGAAVSARRSPRGPAPPVYARWYVWGGLSLAAAGLGGFCGWKVQQAEDDIAADNARSLKGTVEFSDTESIAERGRRYALAANISFGVAGAAAVVATFLIFHGHGNSRAGDAGGLAVTPTRGGLTASFAVAF